MQSCSKAPPPPRTPASAISYFLAFAGFALLVILHEAGHFAVAKLVGMRVERFALFFPPLILRWRRKGSETEYGIGAIPLGGYVKITGMNPAEEIPPEVAHRAYFRQKVWKRIVVIAAGPVVNIVIAFVIFCGVFLHLGKIVDAVQVSQVRAGSVAATALKPGDKVLSVDGVAGYAPGLTDAQIKARAKALQTAINTHRCAGKLVNGCVAATPAKLIVLRDGKRLTIALRPRYSSDPQIKRMVLGFNFGIVKPIGIGESASLSAKEMWTVTSSTVGLIPRLFYSSAARKNINGVVGSYEATRQSFAFDTTQAFFVLGLISLSLGIINLFPFLPLDGGHIFWAVAEKIRGRAIAFSVIEKAGVVGFALVLFLFFIGLQNDIGRLNDGGNFLAR